MSRELTDFSNQIDEQFEIKDEQATDIVTMLLSLFA